jgi:hypothetical protein
LNVRSAHCATHKQRTSSPRRHCFLQLCQALESPLVTISACLLHTSAVRDLDNSAQLASQPVCSSAEPRIPSRRAFNSTTPRNFLQRDFPTGGQIEPSGIGLCGDVKLFRGEFGVARRAVGAAANVGAQKVRLTPFFVLTPSLRQQHHNDNTRSA